jgi:hypothetical protein
MHCPLLLETLLCLAFTVLHTYDMVPHVLAFFITCTCLGTIQAWYATICLKIFARDGSHSISFATGKKKRGGWKRGGWGNMCMHHKET